MEFKVGFNDSRGNYWLGNDLLHQLTRGSRNKYKLRFDLQMRTNQSWYYAEYSSFVVSSEANSYTLLVSGYTGNAGDSFGTHDRHMFATYDRNNDLRASVNCAVVAGGGFWYSRNGACSSWSNVNADHSVGSGFRWYSHETRNNYLQLSRMWLTC